MKRLVLALLLGVAVSSLTMGIDYEYCMDGPGRGLPFAVIHPLHEDAWTTRAFDPGVRNGLGFDYVSIPEDIAFWTALAFSALVVRGRLARKNQPERGR